MANLTNTTEIQPGDYPRDKSFLSWKVLFEKTRTVKASHCRLSCTPDSVHTPTKAKIILSVKGLKSYKPPCKWPVSDYDNKIMSSYKNKCLNFSCHFLPGSLLRGRISSFWRQRFELNSWGICIRRFEAEEWRLLHLPIKMPATWHSVSLLTAHKYAQIQAQHPVASCERFNSRNMFTRNTVVTIRYFSWNIIKN